MDNLSIDTIRKYLQELEQKGYTDLVIARKLSSIVEFINWAYHNDLLKYSQFQQIKDEIANYEAKYDLNHHSKAQNKDIAPHVPEDAAKVSLLQKLRNKVPFLRQNSDKPIATTLTTRLSPQYYLGMAFVVLITGILGAGIYERFLTSTDKIFAYPPSPSAASRILSFQGRLTDSLGNPITASTNMRFRLYTASSGGTTLYDTGTCSITPDQDGVHNVLIGSDCGSEIASSVFTENTQVWLGVLVGSDAEMTPRQRIANVPYAINAETLQGLPVGTEVSTIPYINAGGDLLMAAASPQIGSTYTNQDFLLSSARAITVQSAGTGDVTLTATESGTIKFATGGTQHGLITNTGLFGIGTTGPDAKLDVLYTGGEQLRLTYTDGSNYTAFTTDSGGDVTIDPSGDDVTLGGDLILADTFTVQVGGKTATAYNAFANSGDAPEEAAIAADNDVYIGGDLEVDGTIYGTITASALPWSGLTAPTTDLTVAMAAYNTTFTWDPGANTTETAFTLNFDGEDSAADEDQVLMALNQTSNGTDVTEAADALLTFTNSDANDPVENAIRFDAGAAGTDFTYGINFDAASIGTAEFVLQNGETISNTVDGTIALGGNTDISGTLLAGTADAFQVDASGNVTAVGGTLSGDLAVNGGDITSTATTFNFDIGNTGTLQFRDGSNTLVAIKDQGAYPFLNLAGKTDTGDPASCAEGDIYYNDTDDTIKVCHESNTWEALDGGVVATSWTDSGTTVYLTDTTDEVVIGGSTPLSSAKVSIDGDADQIQLIVQGNATQTSNLATFEQSDGTDVFSVTNAGNLTAAGDLAVNGDDITADGALTINSASYTRVGDTASPGSANGDDDLFIEGDLEVDGVLYTDGGIDTTFTAGSIVFAGTSGVLAQDNTNFFWDDTNNKLGLGDTTPDAKFELSGAATGKALTILNETGDQDIIAASASGTTRFRVSNDGTVYGGYFADISNTAYGIDPAGTSNFGGYSLKVTGGALLGYDSGSVGIGDQTPDAKLNILATTEQLRLDYDDSNYTSFTVSSGGDLTVAPTGSDFNVTGNGDFSGGLNVASSNHFNIDSSGNIGIGTTAASGYGSRMVKSISAESINGYYTDHQAVTYSGTLTGSRNEYGRMTAITNSVDLNGQSLNYYLNQAYFTNSHTSFSGSALGYWAYMTNTVAANNAAMTGFRSDVVNSSTATGQTLTGYTTTTSNGGGTIANSYGYYSNLNNSSSGTISNAYRFYAASPSNASGTITTTYGAYIADQSVGTNTTAYGLYIANQSGGSGDNVGLYIADADDYSIQLASTDGNAASGITFGTDTNLYRSAANTLHTDDNLDIDGNITADGDLAINGDDITADGALTINSASYTRVGDTASPGSANGDDDLFIEGDLEVDGVLYTDGGIDTTFTAGSIVFAGTSGVLAQDNTNFFWDDSSNELGIGDTTPDAFLDVTGTTTQLRLSYETGDTNYTSFTTSSGGDLTIAPSGSDTAVTGNIDISGTLKAGTSDAFQVDASGNVIANDMSMGGEFSGVDGYGDSGSLIANGSLELDLNTGGLPDGWGHDTGSHDGTRSSSGSYNGDYHYRIDAETAENGFQTSCFPVSDAQTYYIDLYAKAASGVLSHMDINYMEYTTRANCEADSASGIGTVTAGLTTTTSWAEFGGSYSPDTGALWLRFEIENNDLSSSTNQDLYIDAVRVWYNSTNGAGGLDLAETYPTDVDDNIQIGEIVAFGNGNIQNEADVHNVKKSQGAYDKNAFGVVATQPGLVLDDDGTYNKIKVALKGRVPVLVSSENGPINVGDPITASSKPGVGMKATKSGRIIGYAMTEWTSTDPNEIDQVTVFINPETYVDLSILTSLQESVAQLPKITASALTRADDIVINAADAVLLKTESLVTQSITAVNATIDTLLVDRIVGREIVAENITSDTIETQNIQAKDATISGKLVAQEIDADNIRELRDRLERLAADNETSPKIDSSQLQAEVESIQKYLEDLPDQNASQNLPMGEITNNTGIDPGTTTSMTGDQVGMMNVEKLMVTGESAMTTLVVADSFTAGNIFVKDNSILSLSSELKLSALEQISLMDGAVIIAKNGTITAKGEIIAEKGIRTNTIKPLDTNSNIGVQLSQNKVEVLNNNAIVAAIDNNGSAKFRDVSVDTYTDATNSAAIIAANDNYEENGIFSPGIQTNAAAAGNGILPATHDSVVIFNDKIGPHTLVYVTATSKTFNQNLYVAEKKVCSELEKIEENCKPYFAVHIDGAVKDPISFNWWTVN